MRRMIQGWQRQQIFGENFQRARQSSSPMGWFPREKCISYLPWNWCKRFNSNTWRTWSGISIVHGMLEQMSHSVRDVLTLKICQDLDRWMIGVGSTSIFPAGHSDPGRSQNSETWTVFRGNKQKNLKCSVI